MLTLALCMVKLYIISTIQGSITIYNPEFGKFQDNLKLTFMFGLIIFGNVVDNVSQPKWVAIFLQLALGASWIINGFIVYKFEHEDEITQSLMVRLYVDAVIL